jgi:hypothetical protein
MYSLIHLLKFKVSLKLYTLIFLMLYSIVRESDFIRHFMYHFFFIILTLYFIVNGKAKAKAIFII